MLYIYRSITPLDGSVAVRVMRDQARVFATAQFRPRPRHSFASSVHVCGFVFSAINQWRSSGQPALIEKSAESSACDRVLCLRRNTLYLQSDDALPVTFVSPTRYVTSHDRCERNLTGESEMSVRVRTKSAEARAEVAAETEQSTPTSNASTQESFRVRHGACSQPTSSDNSRERSLFASIRFGPVRFDLVRPVSENSP